MSEEKAGPSREQENGGQEIPINSCGGQKIPTPLENVGDFRFPSLDQLLMETLPQKSIERYKTSWKLFRSHMKLSDDVIPNEEVYLRYFYYLRKEKKFKGSTLWSIYSRLNACHSRLYGM